MTALEEHLKKYFPDYKLEEAINEGVLLSKDGKGRLFFFLEVVISENRKVFVFKHFFPYR